MVALNVDKNLTNIIKCKDSVIKVGEPCIISFSFSSEWENLEKEVSIQIRNEFFQFKYSGPTYTIPSELITKENIGAHIHIGVFGYLLDENQKIYYAISSRLIDIGQIQKPVKP